MSISSVFTGSWWSMDARQSAVAAAAPWMLLRFVSKYMESWEKRIR